MDRGARHVVNGRVGRGISTLLLLALLPGHAGCYREAREGTPPPPAPENIAATPYADGHGWPSAEEGRDASRDSGSSAAVAEWLPPAVTTDGAGEMTGALPAGDNTATGDSPAGDNAAAGFGLWAEGGDPERAPSCGGETPGPAFASGGGFSAGTAASGPPAGVLSPAGRAPVVSPAPSVVTAGGSHSVTAAEEPETREASLPSSALGHPWPSA